MQELLVEDFDGNDPASLALLLGSYDVDRLRSVLAWGACRACAQVTEADLRLFRDERSLPVRFRALSVRTANNAESMPNGTFPDGLAIVHLKGPWWRTLVREGVLFNHATRRPAWNRDALALYQRAFSEWQLALP